MAPKKKDFSAVNVNPVYNAIAEATAPTEQLPGQLAITDTNGTIAEETPAADAQVQTIEQKPFNNITGMKIFLDTEDQQTTIFVGVEKDGDKDTLRLAVSTKDENGVNGPWAGANLSYDMVAELIEALNIQKSKMKR